MSDDLEEEMEEDHFADGEESDGPDDDDASVGYRALPSLDDMDEAADAEESEPSDYTQHLLLSYLVSAPELWVKCAPIIHADYFDPQYRPVVRNIGDHLKKYKDMPNPDIIHTETGVRLDIKDDAEKDATQTWVCDKVEEFCRTTAFHDFLVRSAEETETDKSRAAISALMAEAALIERISLTRNMGIEVHTGTVETLTESEKDDNITTGFSHMDKAFGGGLTMPSFNIVSCASGDGKSIFMQNMLVNYIEQGTNCIFYSLELEPSIVIKRFAAMMTETHIDQVYTHLDSIGHTMRTRGKTDGALWVKKFPMVGTSMSDIEAHFQELQMHTKLEFKAVAVDYIDIMDPKVKMDKSNIHIKDKLVSEEMNDWAHEQKVILWSASQQTKGAQDEKDPRQSGVSGGTPKISTCDNLIIGKRGEDDIEDERWWAHVQKARSSGANKTKIPLHWDSHTMRMRDGDLDKFKEANPKLFGFRRPTETNSNTPDLIKNDPLAQELGVTMAEKVEETGVSKKAVGAFKALRAMRHQQQDMQNDEAE
jgi:archaellum biogenesis ATPase FlaH